MVATFQFKHLECSGNYSWPLVKEIQFIHGYLLKRLPEITIYQIYQQIWSKFVDIST